ncbi:DUF3006 family protein [Deinococcus sp. VB142]|uniref:DUF3006 family protein n=2 Tax=unclassified Deinococcus TaxID=2623546 RepID=A0AAU6Q626_9DEIO
MGKTEQAVNVILWAAALDGGWGGGMTEANQETWSECWTVDGLEDSPRGPLARVELPSGRTRTVPLRELPEGVREGDLIEVRRGVGGIVFRRLEAETREARARAQARLDEVNRADVAVDLLGDDGEITL